LYNIGGDFKNFTYILKYLLKLKIFGMILMVDCEKQLVNILFFIFFLIKISFKFLKLVSLLFKLLYDRFY